MENKSTSIGKEDLLKSEIMVKNKHLLLFYLEEKLFAADTNYIERVLPMVEITEIPKTKKSIIGVIDYHGEIIPILDLHQRLHLKTPEITIKHKLMIINGTKRMFGFVIDEIKGVYPANSLEIVNSEKVISGLSATVNELAKHEDEFVMIYEIDKILTTSENKSLNEIIENSQLTK